MAVSWSSFLQVGSCAAPGNYEQQQPDTQNSSSCAGSDIAQLLTQSQSMYQLSAHCFIITACLIWFALLQLSAVHSDDLSIVCCQQLHSNMPQCLSLTAHRHICLQVSPASLA